MILGRSFVFVDLPKCGTTSVRRALAPHIDRSIECNKWNWHLRDIPEEAQHLPRFAVVRDPYARALSLWHFERYQVGTRHKNQGIYASWQEHWNRWNLSRFGGFLKRLIENRDTEEVWLYLPCGLFLDPCEPVTVMRLESLQQEWNAQPLLPKIAIPHIRKQEYDRTLTVEQKRLIEAWAREDFERYGYERR